MSFLIDPILLIFCGIAEVGIYAKFLHEKFEFKKVLLVLSTIVIAVFWLIAGLLYVDYLDMPGLGEYGEGNHFMWNSGIEILGFKPFIETSVPTYVNPLGLLNILAVVIFLSYPFWLYLGIKTRMQTVQYSQIRESIDVGRLSLIPQLCLVNFAVYFVF